MKPRLLAGLAIFVLAAAACTTSIPSPSPAPSPPGPSPTTAPTPTPSTTPRPTPAQPPIEVVFIGDVEARCGSIGGCAYFATLTGGALERPLEWRFPFTGWPQRAEPREAPRLLPRGDYRLEARIVFLSDALDRNGVPTQTWLAGSCSTEFTLSPSQGSVGVLIGFHRDTCRIEIATVVVLRAYGAS